MTVQAAGLALLTFLFVAAVPAQTSGPVTELDPAFRVDLDLGLKFRLDAYTGREKSEDVASSKWKVGGGASFRLKPLFKSFLDQLDTDKQHVLVLRVGYEYSRASKAGKETVTHTPMLDGTLRYAFKGKILMSDRNRFELRWINSKPDFRYRNRIQFERPIRIFRRNVSPYGAAEAYWDDKVSKWNLFRFTGGVEFPLFRRTSLDIKFERQHCPTCPDQNTNILGVDLNLFLRFNKK